MGDCPIYWLKLLQMRNTKLVPIKVYKIRLLKLYKALFLKINGNLICLHTFEVIPSVFLNKYIYIHIKLVGN